MALINLTNATALSNVSVAALSVTSAKEVWWELLLFVIGIAIYAIFVFNFYRFLARKNILKLNLHQYKSTFAGVIKEFFGILLYIAEYLLIFPIIVFFWFGVLTVMLTILSSNPAAEILLIAMALVASVRITAYYSEDLSKDLAKMFPFALLGVFLADLSLFSFSHVLEVLREVPMQWESLLYYFVFIVALELLLRFFTWIIPSRKKKHAKEINGEEEGEII